MKVHVLDGLGRPLVLPASRVLVTSDDGTPLALAVELGPGMVDASTCAEPGFNARLRTHGVDRTVQLDRLRPPTLADFSIG